MTLTLSHDQQEAIEKISDWWKSDSQTFSLAGYAGTGKTTIISNILATMREPVIVAAPTGKAALRLRQKGVKASTIHMLAYRLDGVDEEGDLEFTYKGIKEGQALVIIDEASMVNQRIYDDLVNSGYRMLFVGDHGQLAPIGGDPGIMRSPDYTLSVIHRTDDAGLLDFAHHVRMGNHISSVPVTGAVKVFNKNEDQVFAEAALVSADTIICYRNSTRHALNLAMLKERGLVDKTDWETPLELLQALINKPFRCVGLRNNYKVQFFNGQIAELTITDILGDRMAYGNLNMDGVVRTVVLDTSSFLREGKGEERELPGSVQCDFGYALTCHKSQGSEWDNVCVYDDTWSDMKDHQRWCYTAATRAKKGLIWVTL